MRTAGVFLLLISQSVESVTVAASAGFNLANASSSLLEQSDSPDSQQGSVLQGAEAGSLIKSSQTESDGETGATIEPESRRLINEQRHLRLRPRCC